MDGSTKKREAEDQPEAQTEAKKQKVEEHTEEKTETSSSPPSSSSSSSSSSASSSSSGPSAEAAAAAAKGKKRHVTLFCGYSGVGYQGMQRNPGAVTVEDVLEEAIYKAGGISADNYRDFKKTKWNRAARTDKGVHATGQVVSLNMVIDPPGIVERINQHLPRDIRAFAVKRVTGGFNAHKSCDCRLYEYLLPTYVFAPVQKNEDGTFIPQLEGFSFDGAVKSRVEAVLEQYKGTHSFHNFSPGLKKSHPTAKRYIMSFTCSEPFSMEGLELVRLQVKGQSFVLNQIRKMIGLCVEVVRGSAPADAIPTSFEVEHAHFSMAPGEGLLLNSCFFDGYNKKLSSLKSTGLNLDNLPLDYSDIEGDVEKFKHDVIYPIIVSQEQQQKVFQVWLEYVNRNPFVVGFRVKSANGVGTCSVEEESQVKSGNISD